MISSRSMFSRALAALLLVSAVGCAASTEEADAESQDQGVTALAPDYERKSALEKQAVVWSNMRSDEYCKAAAASSPYNLRALHAWAPPADDSASYAAVQLPAGRAASASQESYLSGACQLALASDATPGPSTWDRMRSLFAQNGAFDHNGDEIDKPRVKVIHGEGSAAAVAFQTVNGPTHYTGLLASGQQIPGILRMGEVGVPIGDTIFGLAMKLFVNGQPSRNIHGMTRINGQPNAREPFALPITNMLQWNQGTNFGIVAVLKTLQLVKPDSLQVPVDHLSRMTLDGRDLPDGATAHPDEIVLTPEPRVAHVVHQLLADNPGMDLRQALRTIPVGTVLYRVKAGRNGPNGASNELAEIARVVLVSPLVASTYEDRTLYFRHNRGKWHSGGTHRTPWVSGESDANTFDVNEADRNLATEECRH